MFKLVKLHIFTYDTLHCVRFSGGSLSVSEDSTIISRQNIRHNAFCGLIVNFFLSGVWLKYFVKKVDLSLKT